MQLPKRIQLPVGFQPEGIARGPGVRAFVGTVNGGGVVDVNVLTGMTRFLVQPRPERQATGLLFSPRANAIFVSGAGTGMAFVYDAQTGQDIAVLRLTNQQSFINDVALTSSAAFFTDSLRPVVYRVPLGDNGRPTAAAAIQEIPLAAPFRSIAGQASANGIESVLDGRFLLVVNTSTGELFRVDPNTRQVTLVNLGGMSLMNGDGIRLEGNRLLVVQNQMNQIAVVELDAAFANGRVVQTLRDPDFRIPTTVASFDGVLFTVNARFNEVPGGMAKPTDQFEVVRVAR